MTVLLSDITPRIPRRGGVNSPMPEEDLIRSDGKPKVSLPCVPNLVSRVKGATLPSDRNGPPSDSVFVQKKDTLISIRWTPWP